MEGDRAGARDPHGESSQILGQELRSTAQGLTVNPAAGGWQLSRDIRDVIEFGDAGIVAQPERRTPTENMRH